MSTRAMYTFIDSDDETGVYHVYKHHDGYPSGALLFIRKAVEWAWPLPRFEADDFAAAFVAANKTSPREAKELAEKYNTDWHNSIGGGVRLMLSGPWEEVAPQDIEYRYEVRCKGGVLQVTAFETFHNKEIFKGTLEEFEKFEENEEEDGE